MTAERHELHELVDELPASAPLPMYLDSPGYHIEREGHTIRVKVPRAGVMCIGDAPNDLSMIRWAGMGVATKNAWPEVQSAATEVGLSGEQSRRETANRPRKTSVGRDIVASIAQGSPGRAAPRPREPIGNGLKSRCRSD